MAEVQRLRKQPPGVTIMWKGPATVEPGVVDAINDLMRTAEMNRLAFALRDHDCAGLDAQFTVSALLPNLQEKKPMAKKITKAAKMTPKAKPAKKSETESKKSKAAPKAASKPASRRKVKKKVSKAK